MSEYFSDYFPGKSDRFSTTLTLTRGKPCGFLGNRKKSGHIYLQLKLIFKNTLFTGGFSILTKQKKLYRIQV